MTAQDKAEAKQLCDVIIGKLRGQKAGVRVFDVYEALRPLGCTILRFGALVRCLAAVHLVRQVGDKLFYLGDHDENIQWKG